MEKFGIENVKKIIAIPVEMGNIGDAIGRTKGADKWLKLTGLFDELMALTSVDFKNLGNEFKDMDAVEMAELKKFMADKLDLGDDNVEKVVEKSIEILHLLGDGVLKCFDLVKLIKAMKEEDKVEA